MWFRQYRKSQLEEKIALMQAHVDTLFYLLGQCNDTVAERRELLIVVPELARLQRKYDTYFRDEK